MPPFTKTANSEPDLILHADLRIKEAHEGDEDTDEMVKHIEGFASTASLDEVGDIVRPEAFTDTLSSFMEFPNFFAFHNWTRPIGQIAKAEIVKDEGLWIRGDIYVDTSDGKDIWSLVKRKALRALSIGFMIPEGGVEHNESSGVATITKLELLEISVVALPAQREATFDVAKQLKSWAARGSLPIGRKRSAKELDGGHAIPVDELQGMIDAMLLSASQSALVTSQIVGSGPFQDQGGRSS